MACEHVPVGGTVAIVCGVRRRKCKCGRRATLECDWKVPTKKSGTCDAPLCDRCTTHPEANGRINFDKDLCPKHAAEWAERQRSRRSVPHDSTADGLLPLKQPSNQKGPAGDSLSPPAPQRSEEGAPVATSTDGRPGPQ